MRKVMDLRGRPVKAATDLDLNELQKNLELVRQAVGVLMESDPRKRVSQEHNQVLLTVAYLANQEARHMVDEAIRQRNKMRH